MGDSIKNVLICVGGFLAMFLFLYVFAGNDAISPRVNISAPQVRNDTTSTGYTREPLEEISNTEEVAEAEAPIVMDVPEIEIAQEEIQEEQESQIEEAQDGSWTDEDSAMLLYLSALEITLQNTYGDNHAVDYDGENFVLVKCWNDGVVMSATLLEAYGNTTGWAALKNGLTSMAKDFYAAFGDAGLTDKHIMVNYLNDMNTDNAILSFLDGVCIYDAMEGMQQ